ncbi:DsbA family oxidoreductase [Roseospira marina]|uniref:DsbA family oxidoreductase n=1 Tax=Roseospira marina TaxID=140057 RepID=A0A5M6IEI8_9PROT|nr:DsbA family oxidoreductase [Roseospira marina]KAA5606706.1 DsbA family oxidoreductase [Roseospira marina]MBB4313881.1 putative DsbA family dithiol-disulfide isomerase [Roseospira marina]MBB5087043.1 putative DsbA family dithiol-disulfide isomerase [Roseospira marina]
MRIDVMFDTVCPWCYVGKRRLALALAQRPGIVIDVRYHPFLLNPDMPVGGIDRAVYLERKFGGAHRARRVLEAVAMAAHGTAITFNFSAIRRMPNSVDSHRLLAVAARCGQTEDTLDAVFQAFFGEGRDIGTRAELDAIAAEVGLPEDQVAAEFARPDGVHDILTANGRAHALGINGVPSFVFNEAYSIAGAQEPDVLLRLIDLALETQVREPVTAT